MPLDLDENRSQFQIRAYQPGIIKINDQTYHHSLIITPTKLIENWSPRQANDITAASFTPIVTLKPDILLIGTGEKQIFINTDTYGALINMGIGIEIMSTHAACRTYNALSAENRSIIAALIV